MQVKSEKYIVGKTLITSREIKRRIKVLAGLINADFKGEKLIVLVLLKGSFIFAADLLRQVKLDSTIDFAKVQSYGASMTQKKLVWHLKMTEHLEGKNVLIIDDIYDSGKTLYNVVRYVKTLKPQRVSTCVLLKKRRQRKEYGGIKLDYKGFDVPDVFVVGYGLDFAGRYRNLPYIAKIDKK